MKTLYNIVDRNTQTFLSEPTLQRNLARATKQSLKQQGVDAVILASNIDREQARMIR